MSRAEQGGPHHIHNGITTGYSDPVVRWKRRLTTATALLAAALVPGDSEAGDLEGEYNETTPPPAIETTAQASRSAWAHGDGSATGSVRLAPSDGPDATFFNVSSGRNAPSARVPLTAPGSVELRIYNILGQEIFEDVRHGQVPGWYQVSWDGRDNEGRAVAAGMYVMHIRAGGEVYKQVFGAAGGLHGTRLITRVGSLGAAPRDQDAEPPLSYSQEMIEIIAQPDAHSAVEHRRALEYVLGLQSQGGFDVEDLRAKVQERKEQLGVQDRPRDNGKGGLLVTGEELARNGHSEGLQPAARGVFYEDMPDLYVVFESQLRSNRFRGLPWPGETDHGAVNGTAQFDYDDFFVAADYIGDYWWTAPIDPWFDLDKNGVFTLGDMYSIIEFFGNRNQEGFRVLDGDFRIADPWVEDGVNEGDIYLHYLNINDPDLSEGVVEVRRDLTEFSYSEAQREALQHRVYITPHGILKTEDIDHSSPWVYAYEIDLGGSDFVHDVRQSHLIGEHYVTFCDRIPDLENPGDWIYSDRLTFRWQFDPAWDGPKEFTSFPIHPNRVDEAGYAAPDSFQIESIEARPTGAPHQVRVRLGANYPDYVPTVWMGADSLSKRQIEAGQGELLSPSEVDDYGYRKDLLFDDIPYGSWVFHGGMTVHGGNFADMDWAPLELVDPDAPPSEPEPELTLHITGSELYDGVEAVRSYFYFELETPDSVTVHDLAAGTALPDSLDVGSLPRARLDTVRINAGAATGSASYRLERGERTVILAAWLGGKVAAMDSHQISVPGPAQFVSFGVDERSSRDLWLEWTLSNGNYDSLQVRGTRNRQLELTEETFEQADALSWGGYSGHFEVDNDTEVGLASVAVAVYWDGAMVDFRSAALETGDGGEGPPQPAAEGEGWRLPAGGYGRVAGSDLAGLNYYAYPSTMASGSAYEEVWQVDEVTDFRTGDVDGDGFLEVVAQQDNHVVILDSDGREEASFDLPEVSELVDRRLSLLEDFNGDGALDLLFAVRSGAVRSWLLEVYLYESDGTLLQTFAKQGTDSHIAPLARTGSGDLLVNLDSGYGRDPRGWAAFDSETGEELWYYDVGPAHSTSSIADFDGDGLLELVNAAATVHNGAVGTARDGVGTQTTDGDFYTIVIDENGNEEWTAEYSADGESDGTIRAKFADLDRDGELEVVAFEEHDPTYYHGTSQIHLLDPSDGQILTSFDGSRDVAWSEALVADFAADGTNQILTRASDSTYYRLDHSLQVLDTGSTDLALVVANDLDGDGAIEVIVQQGSVLRVLDGELREEWHHELPAEITSVGLSDLDGGGSNEVLVLAGGTLYVLGAPGGAEPPPEEAQPGEGEITVDLPGGATMEFVWIEPGTFTMGSPESEPGRSDDEGPQHEVTISRGFWLGKYEVTQGQWESVMGTTPWSGRSYVQANAELPAVYISWEDVQELVQALNAAAGDSLYRLPTEAEWEYGCRAGTTTRWSFGDEAGELGDYAWYWGNLGERYAHQVGTKLRNPWGLFDMQGNVWEWCLDWWGTYPSEAQVDPLGPSTGSRRVIRGGYAELYAQYARSAVRYFQSPGLGDFDLGARLLRMAEPAGTNQQPEADPGPDQAAVVAEVITLDGRSSTDPDGDTLTFQWGEAETNPATDLLSGMTAAVVTLTPSLPGTYRFVLVVSDGRLESAPDTVAVTVSEGTAHRDTTVALPGGATMDFVWVEPGTFTMGSPSSEPGRSSNEGPQHEVTITQGYWLGKYEVTQGQWESVMRVTPWSGQTNVQEAADNPAVYISWNEVQDLIGRLNAEVGQTAYRLPTEAEWEHACRAGSTTRWSFGDEEGQLGDYAWYRDNAWSVGEEYGHQVGTRLANPWGVFDMHGNVWEWVQDWYGSYTGAAQVDPHGPATGSARVIRGEDVDGYSHRTRSAIRDPHSPGYRYDYVGARLLRMAEPAERNQPPEADAGPDQAAVVAELISLDGSGSSDADGDTLAYRWTEDGANLETGLLSDATAVSPTFTPSAAGRYQFILMVNDGTVDGAPDTVVVTVSEATAHRDTTVALAGGATMEFVWIEPGTFTMGSPTSEPGRGSKEGPQHKVTITQGFWLGKYEITQGQWEAVMGTTPWSDQSYVQSNASHPAVYISWEDVQELVQALNAAAGDSPYRLPTEGEWEYACRAGAGTRWSFGDEEGELGEHAWYAENAWMADEKYGHAVGTKLSNPWGLFDMHGNVYEWVADWYGSYSSESQVDPAGPSTGSYRVIRGGNFFNDARYTRSGYRVNTSPGLRINHIGARLLRTP